MITAELVPLLEPEQQALRQWLASPLCEEFLRSVQAEIDVELEQAKTAMLEAQEFPNMAAEAGPHLARASDWQKVVRMLMVCRRSYEFKQVHITHQPNPA